MKFEYSVIRVMPSPVTTESLNVAVIVKSDDRAGMRGVRGLSRIGNAFPSVDKEAIQRSLAHLDEQLQSSPTLDLLALSRSTHGALVQVSPPATTIGDSLEYELDELFELFVGNTSATMDVAGTVNGHASSAPLARGAVGRRGSH